MHQVKIGDGHLCSCPCGKISKLLVDNKCSKVKAEKQYSQYDFFHVKQFLSTFTKSKQFYNVICLQKQTKVSIGISDCHKRNM